MQALLRPICFIFQRDDTPRFLDKQAYCWKAHRTNADGLVVGSRLIPAAVFLVFVFEIDKYVEKACLPGACALVYTTKACTANVDDKLVHAW